MLGSINLDDKTYEELMAQAIAKIPLFSREWTNFNISDPGITILQNLTAFNLLQQTTINEVTDELRRKLLEILGYSSNPNQAATLLLQAPAMQLRLPAQTAFKVGELCYETETDQQLNPWGLQAVYTRRGNAYQEITYLLEAQASAAMVFGDTPQPEDSFYCILQGEPDWSKPLPLWVDVKETPGRTPFPAVGGPVFAQTCWQYYTQDGWQDCTLLRDVTHGLLLSGQVVLRIGEQPPTVLVETPRSGYALRCRLVQADYDQPPQLRRLVVNLLPVRQWQTHSWCSFFDGCEQLELQTPLAAQHNLFVYCKEQEDEGYRLYTPFTGVHADGRLYQLEEAPEGVQIAFHEERFGFGPKQGLPQAVCVVCYSDRLVHLRELDTVYGYQDQEVELPELSGLLPQQFSLICRIPDEQGGFVYHFVPPEGDDPEQLCYQLDPQQNKLYIRHAGYGTAYQLLLGNLRTTEGAAGNLRGDSTLTGQVRTADGVAVALELRNPGAGWGGVSYETTEQLKLRFAADMRSPAIAVQKGDYEALVRKTPGLAIHKVNAVMDAENNLVRITVKPVSREQHPVMSPLYQQQIANWLEQRRMLTTGMELLQPQYLPIDLQAVICTKGYYADAADEIETLLRRELDYVDGDQPFAGRVCYNQLYNALLQLPCVASVESLRLMPPADRQGYHLEGADLVLGERSLCYPRQLQIETRTRPST